MAIRIYLIIISLFTFISCQFNIREKALIDKGNNIIQEIESYQSINKCLPITLTDIGYSVTIEGPIYYQKQDSLSFILWFGTTIGESIEYNSQSKKWEKNNIFIILK